jgi:RND superfamily putative drug exporter
MKGLFVATLLYRLGALSAKRAWIVLGSWLILLALSVGWMSVAGGKLTTAMTVDGIPAQQVIDNLKKSFPDASRGTAGLVFHATDGKPFTPEQEQQLSDLLAQADELPFVDATLNPFTTELEIADNAQKIEDGKVALADGQKEIDAAQAQIDAGYAQLDAAQQQLDTQSAQLEATIAQLTQAGAPAQQIQMASAGLAQIEAGQAQIDQQRAALDDAQAQLDSGKAELETSQADLLAGERLLTATEGFSTVSADGTTAISSIFFSKPITEVETSEKDEVMAIFKDANVPGVEIEYSKELASDLGSLIGIGEIVGLLIAAVTLFVMLGTLIAAGLPLLSAVIGVGISASITMGLASVVEMTSTTPVLGVMLGLAVGIDYSLFLINRHRRQLKMGMDLKESIALANGTSGNAVVFAGLTVVIALVALNITGIGFLGLMGTMGAIAIVFAVLIAITMTPALMSLLGMKVLNKKERSKLADAKAQHEAQEPKNAHKPIFATKHPWWTVALSIFVLGVISIPALSLRLGLPDGSSEPVDSTQYRAYQLISDNFGPGANGQVVVVVKTDSVLEGNDLLNYQADVAERFSEIDNVAYAIPAAVSDAGDEIMFQVVPTGGPASEETTNVVNEIRGMEQEFSSDFDAQIGVTGFAASNIDISKKLADALPIYLGSVIILSMLLLMLVFRSIAVPLIASGGFLLTVFATLGAVTAVYQWGWLGPLFDVHDPGPVLNFLPTMLIGILFGLAMDYQLFLASGMREAYVHGMKPKDAINFGVHLSRAVVIAAAIIMISVFGSFIFSHTAMIRPVGFGLAFGVLFDAFIVRLLLVPALMSLLGKGAWWLPRWLDKILPDVDVEGAKLEASLHKS